MAEKTRLLKPDQLSLFATQISLFLRSGLSLTEGLTLMEEDIGDSRFRTCITKVLEGVEGRRPLHDAMRNAGGFPEYMLRMAEIGEFSGRLEGMMNALSLFYEREQNLRQRVKSAVTYPLLLLLMMTAVVFLLIVRVLPMFDRLLGDLGGSMPSFVRGLMNFGAFTSKWYIAILATIAALILFWIVFKRTAAGRSCIDVFKASFPVVRGLYRKMAAERFATAMSFLLAGSVDLEISLDLAKDILGNRHMSKKINSCLSMMQSGSALHDALYQCGIFPRQFSKMLAIGFKSGEMDSMMERLAGIYEQEVDSSLRRLTGAIEPAFVALLSVVVGIIMVSVMLPLIEAMSNIG